MTERDAEADLALCEAATRGPWVVPGYDQAEIAHRHLALGTYPLANFDFNISVCGTRQVTPYTMGDVPDCNFIAEARTALPYWITRCRAAEERQRGMEAERVELEALRLVHTEARELVGEADSTGVIPQANLDALRALLWRASLKAALSTPKERSEG